MNAVGWAALGTVTQNEFRRMQCESNLRWVQDPDEMAILRCVFPDTDQRGYPAMGVWRNLPTGYIQVDHLGKVAKLQEVLMERENSRLTYLCEGPLQLAHRLGLIAFIFKDDSELDKEHHYDLGFRGYGLANRDPVWMADEVPYFVNFIQRYHEAQIQRTEPDWNWRADRDDPESTGTAPKTNSVGYFCVNKTGKQVYAEYYDREESAGGVDPELYNGMSDSPMPQAEIEPVQDGEDEDEDDDDDEDEASGEDEFDEMDCYDEEGGEGVGGGWQRRQRTNYR